MKRILAAAAAAAVAIGVMTFGVSAENVTITGSLDTSAEGFSSGDGYTWNADTKTLTLDNVTIEGNSDSNTGIIADIEGNDSMTIVLNGDNYIKGFREAIGDNVNYPDDKGSLKITGSGSLTITDCTYAANDVQNFIVDGTNIISVTENGFITFNSFTIKNSVFDAKVTTNGFSPIYSCGNITIDSSTVTADMADFAYHPIFTTGAIAIETNPSILISKSEVTVKSKTFGIVCGSVTDGDTIEIAESTINVESAGGIALACGKTIKVDANSKLLAESNKPILRTLDSKTEISVESGAVLEGFVQRGASEFSFESDYTLKQDFYFSSDTTLTIPEGVTLTLDKDVSFLKPFDDDSAKIINNGTIVVPCNYEGTIEIDEGNTKTVTTHSFTDYVYNNDAKVGVDGTETANCDHGCGASDTRTAEGTALSADSSEESSDVSSEASSGSESSSSDESKETSEAPTDSSSADSSASSETVSETDSGASSETVSKTDSKTSSAAGKTDNNPATGAAAGIAAAVLIAGAAVTVLRKR